VKLGGEFIVFILDCPPDEAVVIDDLERNIKMAEKFGMNGILFENPGQLKSEFLKLGIEV